eukprot:m.28644 g.28644  ORF g.28644 m.28644 type:complete len:65 (-) comp9058_c0_seq2:258-452(-)
MPTKTKRKKKKSSSSDPEFAPFQYVHTTYSQSIALNLSVTHTHGTKPLSCTDSCFRCLAASPTH